MTQFDTYKDEEQSTNHTRVLVCMGILFLVFAVGLIWLSRKVNRQVASVRNNFRDRMKMLFIGVLILTCIGLVVFAVLNSIGKKKNYDTHYTPDEEEHKH